MSLVNVRVLVKLCDQEYVRVSSGSGSVTTASRLTVKPSKIIWSDPALTDGAVLGLSRTVTVTLSVTVAVPSSTVRVNSTAVSSSTLGAAKEGSSMSLMNVRVLVKLCVQAYVRVSSVSTADAVPLRFTIEFSATNWSGPAFTVSRLFLLSIMSLL